jgi:DNA-directed RNA polymerase subunit RPC12/RpoP
VCKLSTFGRECEELGYSVDKLMELVKLVHRKASLEKQVSTLNNRLLTLSEHVKRMVAESKGLSVASKILKSRTTSMVCSYCGRTIVVPVPAIWQLGDSLKKGLIYPIRCQYCGYTNQISPRDILASIGWNILAT